MKKLLTAVPFTGFYESDHDMMINDEIESLFQDESGHALGIPDAFYTGTHVQHRPMYEAYSKLYVDQFAGVFEEHTSTPIKLEFESLKSPREYNFTTDRIFCYIPESDVQKLFTLSEDENHITLKTVIRERFTSYDGFASFYSNDLDTWLLKAVADWDHNEIETLIIATLKASGEDAEDFRAWDMMDTVRGNGYISSLVTDNISGEMLAFADYQRESGELQDFEKWQQERKTA